MTPRRAFFLTLKIGAALVAMAITTTVATNALSSGSTLLVLSGAFLLTLTVGLAAAWGVNLYHTWRKHVPH